MPDRLFVYGTLIRGRSNHRLIAPYVHRSQPGTVRGILADLGSFPALLLGDGIVKGVLLDLDTEAIVITDRLEGYHADAPRHCLYLRKAVEVTLDTGGAVEAWTYLFANPDSIADRPRLVVGLQDGLPIYSWRQ